MAPIRSTRLGLFGVSGGGKRLKLHRPKCTHHMEFAAEQIRRRQSDVGSDRFDLGVDTRRIVARRLQVFGAAIPQQAIDVGAGAALLGMNRSFILLVDSDQHFQASALRCGYVQQL